MLIVCALCFLRCDVSEWFEELLGVEPIGPFEGFPLNLMLGFLWPKLVDDFGL